MKKIFLRIAGFNIKINFYSKRKISEKNYSINRLDKEIMHFFRVFINYGNTKNFDILIQLFRSHIITINKRVNPGKKSKFMYFYEENGKIIKSFQYISFHQLFHIIYYMIQKLILLNKGFIIHGSVVVISNKAVIFIGRSGAGKSTAVKLLKNKYRGFADDVLIVRKLKERFFAFQTPSLETKPWIAKTNSGYPIDKIFFLRKNSGFKIKKIDDKGKIFSKLLPQIQISKPHFKSQSELLKDFVMSMDNFYLLFFPKRRKEMEDGFSF